MLCWTGVSSSSSTSRTADQFNWSKPAFPHAANVHPSPTNFASPSPRRIASASANSKTLGYTSVFKVIAAVEWGTRRVEIVWHDMVCMVRWRCIKATRRDETGQVAQVVSRALTHSLTQYTLRLKTRYRLGR